MWSEGKMHVIDTAVKHRSEPGFRVRAKPRPRPDPTPSARLEALIALYRHAAAAFDIADATHAPDTREWADAAEADMDALTGLLAHRPATQAEFCAKFEALIPATADDSEFHVLRVLADDARMLIRTTR